MDRWVGKVAVVTGASSKYGAAIAEKLVMEGLQVVGLARRVELIESNAKKLSNKKGKLFAVKTDITKEEDIINAIEWTVNNVGPISILINNAEICKRTGLINSAVEDWKQILETNVLGLSVTTSEIIKNMQSNNIDGHIVFINSIAGQAGTIPNVPKFGMYPASKLAITAVNEMYRQELTAKGSKIKTTSVSLSCMKVAMADVIEENMPENLHATIKSGPCLKPKAVADVVWYALLTPPDVQICEVTVRPLGETI